MSQKRAQNDDERTKAVGLARYACEYYEAGVAADDVIGEKPGHENVAPASVMFMMAHAIELILKSFLRSQGCSLGETKALGYDLEKCWERAVQKGVLDHVQLSPDELGVLGLINDPHVSAELRYIVTGAKTYPVFGPLQRLVYKLLEAISKSVGWTFRPRTPLHV